MELKELYQEIILDHGKNPRNKGICTDYSHDAKAHNPLCGDKVHVYLKLDKEKKVIDLSFEGEGCAISLCAIYSYLRGAYPFQRRGPMQDLYSLMYSHQRPVRPDKAMTQNLFCLT